MYHHVKKLMDTVNIGEPNVRFGNMLLGLPVLNN
jgi:Mn-containing catalase